MDLLMVDSTNAEVPGLDVIADGLEGDQTGNLPVSKRAEGAKSLVAASPKHTGMPLLFMKGFGRGVWSSAKAAGLYIYATFDNEGVETRFPRCGKTLCTGPLPAEPVSVVKEAVNALKCQDYNQNKGGVGRKTLVSEGRAYMKPFSPIAGSWVPC